ncbi:MAG: putative signal transducing protein [Gemmatimonadota bacterium]
MPETAVVATFSYRHQAEMARGYLDDAGIPVVMVAGDAAGIELGFAAPNRARLAVRAEDVERARQLLADAGFEESLV